MRIVPLQTMSNEASALEGNQVDAALLPATVATPLVARGSAHLLGWVGDETPWQLGAVFAAAQDHRRTARGAGRAFIKAYRHGVRDYYDAFLAKNPDGTAKPGARRPRCSRSSPAIPARSRQPIKTAIPYIDPQRPAPGPRHLSPGRVVSESRAASHKDVEAASILDIPLIVYDK